MKSASTTTYHPKANGQCEGFNGTLLAGLRAFVSEHPKSWPEYAQLLAFAYNAQVHPSTGHTLFELILSNPPKSLTLKAEPSHGEPQEPIKLHEQFRKAVGSLTHSSSKNIDKAQERYSRNFDRRIRPVDPQTVGDFVYVRR